jgi:hypothetical protein
MSKHTRIIVSDEVPSTAGCPIHNYRLDRRRLLEPNAILTVTTSCVWPDYCWQAIGHHLVPTAPIHTECHVPHAAGFAHTHLDQRAPRRRLPPDLGYHDRAWMRK